MKSLIIAFFVILWGACATQTPIDSAYFQKIGDTWYEITADYDENGKLIRRLVEIVGETGDSSEVAQLSRNAPINMANQWANNAGQAINGLVYVRQLIRDFGGLWESVTGSGAGGYVTERSSELGSQYLEGADSLGRKKCRIFIFGASQGNFYLTQLPNQRMRLTSVSDPGLFYAFVPWSQNSFQIVGLNSSNEALVAKRLGELKSSIPSISAQLDEAIAALGSFKDNPTFVLTGEVVRNVNGQQRKFQSYNDLEGRVRLLFID